jgi:site-specific DNA-methyltransferase (adenine-specific)
MSQSKFRFAPQMDLSKSWTDDLLYRHFGISKDEIAFIESLIREMTDEK